MIDIAVVSSNSSIYDPRVQKIVGSLIKRYSTVVLGWNREGAPRHLIDNHMPYLKLLSVKAPLGKPTLVPYYPLFWVWVIIQLFIYKPNIVHACNLETFLPSYIYKLVFRKKLVFDIFDRYAMANIPQKYGALYSLVNLIEEMSCWKADVLVTVSDSLLRSIRRKPKDCSLIMNCVEDYVTDRVNSDDYVLTLVYAGIIVEHRGLESVADAIRDLNNVEFIVAGRVYHQEVLEKILDTPHVKYKGLLQPREALSLEAHADAIVVLLDFEKVPDYNFAMPNKMFEAMMFGIPIITNAAIEFVRKIDFGITVEYNNKDQIRSAIVNLRDDLRLRKMLGENGRKAFLEKYNWTVMESKLYQIYDNLLKKEVQTSQIV